MKKKIIGGGNGAAREVKKHLAAVESNLFHGLPAIIQHCCVTQYEDGDPRKPGWITIKTMGSAWVVQVKDPDSCCALTATAQSLDDVLALAELLLSGDEAPWEPDPFLQRLGAPKKGSK